MGLFLAASTKWESDGMGCTAIEMKRVHPAERG